MKTPLHICVIQLTRIGDIIQTYRAAKQLKQENDNVKLTLITRRRFSSQLNFLLQDAFDEVVEFETKDFFPNKTDNLNKIKIRLHNFIHDLKKYNFDLVINYSFTKSSSYLTTLISDELKMGLYRNQTAQIAINDKWSQYIYSNVLESTQCPINLVDIYKAMIGAKETNVTSFKTPKNKLITIHPFASTHKKSWGSGKWVELLYKLFKEDKDIEVAIVGAPNDTDLADRIVSNNVLKMYNKRIINKVGVNSIEDTFNLLSNSHLFIGHDSMVSHLAGVLRMPSIVLSLGTVRPHETTPYNDRVINLVPRNKCFPCNIETSCELLPCHNSLKTQAVSKITHTLLNNENIQKEHILSSLDNFDLESMDIYMASFDEAGLNLNEITGNNHSSKAIFKTYYRILWSYYLKGIEINAEIPKASKDTLFELNHHSEGIKHLYELYTHGFNFCNQILDESEKDNPSVENIQNTVTKLGEIDELVSVTKNAFPLLAPLADFFFVHKSNVAGENIIEITNNNLIAFHDAINMTAILNDLLQKTIGPRIQSNSKVSEV